MARAKKETALTPEERLQAALVPDWEWPYKLPGNWCWIKITVITDILNGFAFKSQHYSSAGIRIIRITNVQDGFIQDKKPVYYPLESQKEITPFMLKDGDFLMSLTGNVGRVAIIDASFLPAALNQRVACLRIKSEDSVRKEYIFYFCLQKQFVSDCIKSAKGSAQLNMSTEWLKEYPIPLPPLAEQQRIVDRIESLFSKLDEAKEKAQAVVDSFETRKAAILHKAFTGELTAKWREEHDVGMESWEVRTLDSVCSSIFDGDHMPPPKAESGIPFLVISNVNTGHLTFENTRFVPQEYYDTLSDTRKPQLGDVLYTLVGSFGIPVVVNSKRPFCFQRHMALLRPIDVSPQFLWYILQTPEMYDKASSIATGTAQLTVPIKGLRAMTIPRPNIAEQVEIVRILDGFFAREQSAKEAAEAVLDQIDLMKKSILARAFRGELGTNDPSEESAVELLKQII